MPWLDYNDTINGAEARAYAMVDGQNLPMFYLKNLETTVKKDKKSGKTLGNRATQHKATGWSGEGSATLYYATSYFRQMMLKYMKTGVDTYFDIAVTNDDPSSKIGVQTIILKRCNLDEVSMALIDVENEALEEDISFTFEDVDMPDAFSEPTLLG